MNVTVNGLGSGSGLGPSLGGINGMNFFKKIDVGMESICRFTKRILKDFLDSQDSLMEI